MSRTPKQWHEGGKNLRSGMFKTDCKKNLPFAGSKEKVCLYKTFDLETGSEGSRKLV